MKTDKSVPKGDSGSAVVQYLFASNNRALLIGLIANARYFNKTTTGCFEHHTIETMILNVHPHLNWIRFVLNNTDNILT